MGPSRGARYWLLRLPREVGRARSAARPCNNGCIECRTDPALLGTRPYTTDVRGRDVLLVDYEPLLARPLPGVVRDLRSRGARSVGLVSNGRLASYPSFAEPLARAGVDRVFVKLFGPDAATHDAHTRVPGSFDQAHEAARQLDRARVAVTLLSLGPDEPLEAALARAIAPSDRDAVGGRHCYDVLEPRSSAAPQHAGALDRAPETRWIGRYLPMIHIPTGNRCNSRCIYCNVQGGPEQALYPADELYALLDHAARRYLPTRVGVPTIDFIGGEPTIAAELPRLIERARALGFPQVTVCTNGQRLTEPGFLARLVAAGLTGVRLSLHDHRAEVAGELSGAPAAGGRLLEAAQQLLAQSEVQVHIYRILLAPTLDALGDYLRWLAAHRSTAVTLDVALGLPSPRGRMLESPALLPALAALRPAVAEAARRARELDLELCVHHAPACIEPAHPQLAAVLWSRTVRIDSVTGAKSDLSFEGDTCHAARCAPCAARDRCYGLARRYFEQDRAQVERWVAPLHELPAEARAWPGASTLPSAAAMRRAAEPEWLAGVRRTLLVNPPVADTTESAEQDMLTCTAPIGLLRAARWLRDRGREVRWLDCMRDAMLGGRLRRHVRAELACGNEAAERLVKPIYHFGLDSKTLAKRLAAEPEPDLVAIGATFTWQLEAVRDLIACCRAAFPQATIAVGGNCARLVPGAVRGVGADVVVSDDLPGGDFVPAALDLLGEPDGPDYPSLVRGCPHRCEYCVTPRLGGGRVVARDPELVVAAMRARAAEAAVSRFVFFDDFIHYQQSRYLDRLLDLVIAERAGWRLEFALGFACGLVDEPLVRRLRDAGVEHAIVALETTSESRRVAMKRPDAALEFERATAILRDYGYRGERLRAFYLVGLPDQTTAEILRTVAWLYAREVTPSLTTYALTPGTGDWNRYRSRVAHRSLGELAPALWPFAHPGMRVPDLDSVMRLFHERFRTAAAIDEIAPSDDPMLGALKAAAHGEGVLP